MLPAAENGAIDLKPALSACDATSADRIVVCGKRSDRYRIAPAPAPSAEAALPPARFKLFGQVPTRMHVEQVDVGGFPSQRAMVTFSISL